MKLEIESKFNKGDRVIEKAFRRKLIVIDVKWDRDTGWFSYLCEEKNRERKWFYENKLEEDK